MNGLLILGFLVATAVAVPAPEPNALPMDGKLDCADRDTELLSCVFVKTVSTLNRAARSGDLEVFDGVKFVRETPMERNGKSLMTELELMNELPRDASDRTMKLISMLYESAMSFVKSHSLKLSMPEEGSISRALVEGRGKIKKMVLPLVAAAGLKIFALVPILVGGLGLLALKALLASKLALLVAGILGFQKFFGTSNPTVLFGKNNQPSGGWYDAAAGQAWSAGVSGAAQPQGYYKRSFDVATGKTDAHSMAYAAQAPVNEAD